MGASTAIFVTPPPTTRRTANKKNNCRSSRKSSSLRNSSKPSHKSSTKDGMANSSEKSANIEAATTDSLSEKWVCDVCHKAVFDCFEEACAHEEFCLLEKTKKKKDTKSRPSGSTKHGGSSCKNKGGATISDGGSGRKRKKVTPTPLPTSKKKGDNTKVNDDKIVSKNLNLDVEEEAVAAAEAVASEESKKANSKNKKKTNSDKKTNDSSRKTAKSQAGITSPQLDFISTSTGNKIKLTDINSTHPFFSSAQTRKLTKNITKKSLLVKKQCINSNKAANNNNSSSNLPLACIFSPKKNNKKETTQEQQQSPKRHKSPPAQSDTQKKKKKTNNDLPVASIFQTKQQKNEQLFSKPTVIKKSSLNKKCSSRKAQAPLSLVHKPALLPAPLFTRGVSRSASCSSSNSLCSKQNQESLFDIKAVEEVTAVRFPFPSHVIPPQNNIDCNDDSSGVVDFHEKIWDTVRERRRRRTTIAPEESNSNESAPHLNLLSLTSSNITAIPCRSTTRFSGRVKNHNTTYADQHAICSIPSDVCGKSNQAQSRLFLKFLRDWKQDRILTDTRRATQRQERLVAQQRFLMGEKPIKKKKTRYKEDDWEYSDSDGDDDEGAVNVYVLIGPSGCGKTNLVHAASKQLNCHVIEIGTGLCRGGSALKKRIEEATLSRSLGGTGGGSSDDQKNGIRGNEDRFSLVLIDEVENMFDGNGDVGFWPMLKQLSHRSKCPLILTSSVLPPQLNAMGINHELGCLNRPSALECANRLSLVAEREGWGGVKKKNDYFVGLAQMFKCDLRKCLLEMQLLRSNAINPGSLSDHTQLAPSSPWIKEQQEHERNHHPLLTIMRKSHPPLEITHLFPPTLSSQSCTTKKPHKQQPLVVYIHGRNLSCKSASNCVVSLVVTVNEIIAPHRIVSETVVAVVVNSLVPLCGNAVDEDWNSFSRRFAVVRVRRIVTNSQRASSSFLMNTTAPSLLKGRYIVLDDVYWNIEYELNDEFGGGSSSGCGSDAGGSLKLLFEKKKKLKHTKTKKLPLVTNGILTQSEDEEKDAFNIAKKQPVFDDASIIVAARKKVKKVAIFKLTREEDASAAPSVPFTELGPSPSKNYINDTTDEVVHTISRPLSLEEHAASTSVINNIFHMEDVNGLLNDAVRNYIQRTASVVSTETERDVTLEEDESDDCGEVVKVCESNRKDDVIIPQNHKDKTKVTVNVQTTVSLGHTNTNEYAAAAGRVQTKPSTHLENIFEEVSNPKPDTPTIAQPQHMINQLAVQQQAAMDQMSRLFAYKSDAMHCEDMNINSLPELAGAVPGFGYAFTSTLSQQRKSSSYAHKKLPNNEKLYSTGLNDYQFFHGCSDAYVTNPIRDRKLLSRVAKRRGLTREAASAADSIPGGSNSNTYPGEFGGGGGKDTVLVGCCSSSSEMTNNGLQKNDLEGGDSALLPHAGFSEEDCFLINNSSCASSSPATTSSSTLFPSMDLVSSVEGQQNQSLSSSPATNKNKKSESTISLDNQFRAKQFAAYVSHKESYLGHKTSERAKALLDLVVPLLPDTAKGISTTLGLSQTHEYAITNQYQTESVHVEEYLDTTQLLNTKLSMDYIPALRRMAIAEAAREAVAASLKPTEMDDDDWIVSPRRSTRRQTKMGRRHYFDDSVVMNNSSAEDHYRGKRLGCDLASLRLGKL